MTRTARKARTRRSPARVQAVTLPQSRKRKVNGWREWKCSAPRCAFTYHAPLRCLAASHVCPVNRSHVTHLVGVE